MQKREAVVDEIKSSFLEIEGLLPFEEYATSTHDRCHRGDNNLYRSDFYSNHCGYRITKFYGLNGDFRQLMLNFEEELIEHGWEVEEYAKENPMVSLMKDFDRNYGNKLLYEDGIYDVSNLGSSIAKYIKNDQEFRVEFAEKSTTDFQDIEYIQNEESGIAAAHETYEVKNFQNNPELFNKIVNENRYMIAISIQKEYYEN